MAGIGAAGGATALKYDLSPARPKSMPSNTGEIHSQINGSTRSVGILRLRKPIRLRESACFAQDDNLCLTDYVWLTWLATHSPASFVPSGPPMSCVVFF